MISLDNLGFTYRKRKPVFQGLTLTIPQGRTVGILGANGVGKTTLIRLLSGLISPSEGAISVDGFTPRQRKTEFFQKIFLVPEESELPPIRGSQYLKTFAAFYPNFNYEQFHNITQQFTVDEQQNLQEMSLGQKKKFLVAFAMATQCPLILMDEPTNGLDIPAKAQFRDMIIQFQTDEQTFLISTHQVRDLESVIDSVVMMNEQHAHWLDLNTLTDAISQVAQIPEQATALYSEQRMGMTLSIIEGAQPYATDLDLELLFNTFHTNYSGLMGALSKETAE
jgi:ABC-2 type transport system ATP-binding protein